MEKKAEFSFVWLFAIVAGGAILFLMIYGAIKFGQGVVNFQDTELAKQISIYTEPMQAGFSEGKKSVISSKNEVVLKNFCDDTELGYQEISAKYIKNLNEEFDVFGEPIRVKNKYVYTSEEPSKKFYVLSYPVTFSFRVADLVIISSGEYCFLDGYEAFPYLEESLGIAGDAIKFGTLNCTENSIKVCLDYSRDCDIIIRGDCFNPLCSSVYETGTVQKKGDTLRYAGNLVFPAIFSEKEIYDCNLRRIAYKNGVLSSLYLEKLSRLSRLGCDAYLKEGLDYLIEKSFNFDVNSLTDFYLDSKEIKEEEEGSRCKLWS